MANSTPGQDVLAKMVLHIKFTDEAAGQRTELDLPFHLVCLVLPIMKSASPAAVRGIALLGAMAAMHPNEITGQAGIQIGRIFNALERTIAEQWHNQEEMLIQATYVLLREGTINRKQAAAVAKTALGKNINDESWRKRVDRYASAPERKWPLPGKPRGGNR